MALKTVFVLVAQLQSGKDTFGDFLVEFTGAARLAFADPLKEIAILLLAMPREIAFGGEKERRAWKKYGKDAREWLQWIGTEFGRVQIDQDVWIHRAIDRIQMSTADAFVITDGRFKNEICTLEESLGSDYRVVLLRLKRPGFVNDSSHASEAEQLAIPDDVFHEVIINDGTLSDLSIRARAIADYYQPTEESPR